MILARRCAQRTDGRDRVILTEARRPGEKLLESLRVICHCMQVAFKTVYKHDTWTCPVTAQQSLQEICRASGEAEEPLQDASTKWRTLVASKSCERQRGPTSNLRDFAALTKDEFSSPDFRDMNVCIDQANAYLSGNSGLPVNLCGMSQLQPALCF